ncbi:MULTISPECIES: cysteine-rich CWC family protein [Bacillaceae]|uniref:cysteine-rich CWC family protein n=1 Tax=Bacillaceae TaxID=186817 RepID=UPI00101B8E40|nr:cysteine-rich CWC family protein [Ectobacillus funiculus]
MNNEIQKSFECPICSKSNNCGSHSCWCSKEVFPSGIFDLVPANQLRKSCICKECLDRFKEGQQ